MIYGTIRTPRLFLRLWDEGDFPAFAAMNADWRVMEFLPKLLERTESDAIAAGISNNFGLTAPPAPVGINAGGDTGVT